MKFLSNFIKHLVSDKFVQIFVLAHSFSLIIVYFWIQDKEITSHNFYYQPLLLKIFAILNLPSILATGFIFALLLSVFPSAGNSWWIVSIYYLFLIILSIFQWALIGYAFSKLLNRNRIRLM